MTHHPSLREESKCINLIYSRISKGKKGTHRFHRLATVHSVTDGQRLTLGTIVVREGDKPKDMVE